MQHGDGDDEAQVEPVGNVDVRFLALEQRAHEDRQIGHPDDGEPDVDIPLRLGIFLGLGYAHQIAGGGQDDEQLVAPEYEPGQVAERQAGAAGALQDVEAGADQRIAAEGKDHRRRVQWAQAAEIGDWPVEIEDRKGELRGDDDADEEAGDAPEHGGDDTGADDAVHVAIGRCRLAGGEIITAQRKDNGEHTGRRKYPGMGCKQFVVRVCNRQHGAEQRQNVYRYKSQ